MANEHELPFERRRVAYHQAFQETIADVRLREESPPPRIVPEASLRWSVRRVLPDLWNLKLAEC